MHVLFKMTRDLLFFTFLLLIVRRGATESLFGDANDTNSSWVCDLGRTTGSCLLCCTKHLESSIISLCEFCMCAHGDVRV